LHAEQVKPDEPTRTIAELRAELVRFEAEARRAGLKEPSVMRYVDRSARFIRWLASEYQFQGAVG
jgi:hypothetical protein